MEKKKEIALELAMILIQKADVVPVPTMSSVDSISIEYTIGTKNYTFFEIVSHFLECIEKIDDDL